MKSISKNKDSSFQINNSLLSQKKDKEKSINSFSQSELESKPEQIKKVKTSDSTIKSEKLTTTDDKDNRDHLVRERIIKHHIQKKPIQSNHSKSYTQKQSSNNDLCFEQKATLNNLINDHASNIIDSLSFTRSENSLNKVFVKNKYSHLF